MLTMMQAVVAIVCFCVGVVMSSSLTASSSFALPDEFEGTWFGTPEFNIMGPLQSYLFSISKTPGGDYLFEINLHYDTLMIGYQRFYVEGYGETAGTLWYCGKLSNFSDSTAEETGGARPNTFLPVLSQPSSNTTVTFCLDSSDKAVMGGALDLNPFMKGCSSCDCANWTLSYDTNSGHLLTQLSMGGSEGHTHSKHLWGELKKVGPPPVVNDSYMPGHGSNFSCNFTTGGRDSVPVDRTWKSHHGTPAGGSLTAGSASSGCPFARLFGTSAAATSSLEAATQNKIPTATPRRLRPYDHCYTLNARSGYQVAWTFDTTAQVLHCSVSAPVISGPDGDADLYRDSTWVAIGFRPQSRSSEVRLSAQGTGHHMNFGMEGADIVAGSVAGGVRTMYAALYTGPPTPDASLAISDGKVEVQRGDDSVDRVVLSFTRPLVGGYLYAQYGNNASINTPAADIIWASGLDNSSSDVGCNYHNNLRGLRVIDWENPEIAMVDAWKCR
jgi:hypothetical protein